jgi:hypothetical protein
MSAALNQAIELSIIEDNCTVFRRSGFNPTAIARCNAFCRVTPARSRPWLYGAKAPTTHAQTRPTESRALLRIMEISIYSREKLFSLRLDYSRFP